MRISINLIERGITEFAESEILPHLPSDGVAGFGIGVAAALAISRVGQLIDQLAKNPAISMLGIVDDDGVDIDALYEAAVSAMPDKGLHVDIGKHRLKFGKSDLEKLYSMIVR